MKLITAIILTFLTLAAVSATAQEGNYVLSRIPDLVRDGRAIAALDRSGVQNEVLQQVLAYPPGENIPVGPREAAGTLLRKASSPVLNAIGILGTDEGLSLIKDQEHGAYSQLTALATAVVYLRPSISRIYSTRMRGELESGMIIIFYKLLDCSQEIIHVKVALPWAPPQERDSLLVKDLRETALRRPNGPDKDCITAAIAILTAPAR